MLVVATAASLRCPSRERFHVWAKELLVLLLRVAALSGLLMRSWERRERTCSGTYLATCPTSRGERCGALAGRPALFQQPGAVPAGIWWDLVWGRS